MKLELVVCTLCMVSFFLLCWAFLLRVRIEELRRKVKELENYFVVKKKLDEI